MQDLTKLQDMFMQIEPAAQKVIIDLLEILYKRNEVPNGLNIFDMQAEVEEESDLEVNKALEDSKTIDNFKEESPKLFANKPEKRKITKEELEDMALFEDDPEPLPDTPKEKPAKAPEIIEAPDLSSGYLKYILQSADLYEVYKKQPMAERQVVAKQLRQRHTELKVLPLEEQDNLLKENNFEAFVGIKTSAEKLIALYKIAAKQLGYVGE